MLPQSRRALLESSVEQGVRCSESLHITAVYCWRSFRTPSTLNYILFGATGDLAPQSGRKTEFTDYVTFAYVLSLNCFRPGNLGQAHLLAVAVAP